MKASLRKISKIVRVIIGVSLITYLLYRMDYEETVSLLRHTSAWSVLFPLALYAIVPVVKAYRWQMLCKCKEIEAPFSRCLSLTLIGLFVGHFLPGSVSGDISRIYGLSRSSKEPIQTTSSVIVERLTGFVTLLLVSALGLCGGVTDGRILLGLVLFCALLLVFSMPLLARYLGITMPFMDAIVGRVGFVRKIDQVYASIYDYKDHKLVIAKTLALSIVFPLITSTSNYLVSKALGLDVPLIRFVAYTPIIQLVTMLPISIGGLGVREGLYVFFFRPYGMTESAAMSIAVITRLLLFSVSAVGGLLYTLRGLEDHLLAKRSVG